MTWITFLLVGLFSGLIAKAVTPGTSDEPSSWPLTIVLGVTGAYIGGFIATTLGFESNGNGFVWSVLMATLGSIVIIALLRMFSGNRRIAR